MNYTVLMRERSAESRLIEVAIEQFGQSGMRAVGTRAIADAAGMQMSAITYHFGGKDGLYLACARHIAGLMSERIAPFVQLAESHSAEAGGPASARTAILDLLGGLVTVMMRDEIAPWARFVVREQMNPTPAFEVLYEGVMQRILALLGDLLQRVAGGALTAEETRIRSIALVGQVLAFRFCRAALMYATGWESVGVGEIEVVRTAVLAHTDAVLIALERGASQ
jgi:TetR/AcrR family transcriptional regulator, regulator of cefoperazone and chloramphenicol sensitivity